MERPGTYALGASYANRDVPGVSAGRYEATDAAPITNDIVLFSRGTLWVTEVTADRIAAAISTDTVANTWARGTFTAPICAPDGGAP